MLGIQTTMKKTTAPKNLERTTCQSPTGAVMSVSIVPSLNSSAKSRMVMGGTSSSNEIQNGTESKNASTTVMSPVPRERNDTAM